MTTPSSLTIALRDEASTARLMADIGLLIGARDVITLSGDLGAGKTAAARALLRYLAGNAELESLSARAHARAQARQAR